jgi:hypothetical protein
VQSPAFCRRSPSPTPLYAPPSSSASPSTMSSARTRRHRREGRAQLNVGGHVQLLPPLPSLPPPPLVRLTTSGPLPTFPPPGRYRQEGSAQLDASGHPRVHRSRGDPGPGLHSSGRLVAGMLAPPPIACPRLSAFAPHSYQLNITNSPSTNSPSTNSPSTNSPSTNTPAHLPQHPRPSPTNHPSTNSRTPTRSCAHALLQRLRSAAGRARI